MRLLRFIIFSGIYSVSVLAGNSLDIKVPKMDYQKPPGLKGKGGEIVFDRFIMIRDGMSLSINNKDLAFNSNIFVNKNFIGFKTKSGIMNLGFLFDGNTLDSVNNAQLRGSRVAISSKIVNFTASHFKLNTTYSSLDIKNVRVHCIQNYPQYTEFTKEFFFSSCLENATANGLNEGSLSDAMIEFKDRQEGKVMKLKSLVNRVDIKKEKIILDSAKTSFIADEKFEVRINDLIGECAKEAKLTDINPTELEKKCTNDLYAEAKRIIVRDGEEGTKFFLKPKSINFEDERFKAKVDQLQVFDGEESTNMYDLDVNCFKNPENRVTDQDLIISDCMIDSEIYIKGMIGDETGKLASKISSFYTKLFAEKDNDPMGISNPMSVYDGEKYNMKKLQISISTVSYTHLTLPTNPEV